MVLKVELYYTITIQLSILLQVASFRLRIISFLGYSYIRPRQCFIKTSYIIILTFIFKAVLMSLYLTFLYFSVYFHGAFCLKLYLDKIYTKLALNSL